MKIPLGNRLSTWFSGGLSIAIQYHYNMWVARIKYISRTWIVNVIVWSTRSIGRDLWVMVKSQKSKEHRNEYRNLIYFHYLISLITHWYRMYIRTYISIAVQLETNTLENKVPNVQGKRLSTSTMIYWIYINYYIIILDFRIHFFYNHSFGRFIMFNHPHFIDKNLESV